MELINHTGLPLFQFFHFKNIDGLVHGVTTRKGGVSEGPFFSLNLGTQTGDDPQRVFCNRDKLLSHLSCAPSSVVIPNQVHGKNVVVITKERWGIDSAPHGLVLSGVDGLTTKEKGVLLMIKVADCIPVFLYDPASPAISLIHAGWRGTAAGIIAHGVDALEASFGTKPTTIKAGIGPGIGACCYEVKEDVREAFLNHKSDNSVWKIDADKKIFLDLKKAIFLELINCGLTQKNIETAPECTSCNPELFFSHRRDKGKTGRMAAVMGLV
jgi:YfiH family protein